MDRRLLAIALWTTALAGGWWAGHAQRPVPVKPAVAVPQAPRKWSDDERLKRVAELLEDDRRPIGDEMEIDGHLAAMPLDTLRATYDRKVPDPIDSRQEGWGKRQRERGLYDEMRRRVLEAWCRRDPFDFINLHPDPPVAEMDFALRQAVIKDPRRTMRYMEKSRQRLGYNVDEFFRALAEYYPDLALQEARAWPEEMVNEIAWNCIEKIRDSAQRWEWAEMVHYRRKEKGEDTVRHILELIAKVDPEFLKGRAGQGVLAAYPDMLPGDSPPPPQLPIPTLGEALPALEDGALPDYPNVHGDRWANWAARDPEAAFAWLDSIKDPFQREDMLDEVVYTAVRTDLQRLDQLLAHLTRPDERKRAIGVAVGCLEDKECVAPLRRFVNRYAEALEEVSNPAILNP